jgi:hypothetical protein
MQHDLSSLAYIDAEHDFGPNLPRDLFYQIQDSLTDSIELIKNEDSAITRLVTGIIM